MIKYLKNSEIDFVKWNRCIDNASNGIIYAYSDHLDAMSKNWDALVMDDYKSIMPLTWKKKYGIYYLRQPFFSASLGIFGNHLDGDIVYAFLEAIPARFQYWDIYLNKGNVFPIKKYSLYLRNNYILNLLPAYSDISDNFSESHQRNIKTAVRLGFSIQKNIPIQKVVKLAYQQSKTFSPLKLKDYAEFTEVFKKYQNKEMACTYGAFSDDGILKASCAFIFSHGRAYYIMVGNNPAGRKMGASHFMIDRFIHEYSGTNLILDFEGSQLPGLARFYRNFGAREEKYPGIKVNRLPAIVKLFKQ